ncbi:MAG: gamma-glutamyltransferase [Balneolaceae bacterium]|nr:MAG: gamma-glutamyltransferase [Balneolaceae bacterium]
MMNYQSSNALKGFILSLLFLPFLIISGCDQPEMDAGLTYTIPEQPELPTGFTPKPGWATSEFAVAAANPLATDAGYQIIRAGGSAIDAAIAVQLVLSLVEPQSSGIGGGAFILAWDGEEIHAYNGRETAPAAADENHFLDENADPLPFASAVRSGLSVGVPGTLALLKTVYENHGVLPWEDLFTPAILLAEDGFKISPRLHSLLDSDEALKNDPVAREYFYDEEGNALAPGTILKTPAYAEILRNVASRGISAFYEGSVAEDIVKRVTSHERPGVITEADIAAYPALDLRTEVMCNDWREYEICGFPPPSSGHIAIMQILGILDELDPVEEALVDSIPSAEWLHQFMEASKLAFADRNQYIGDPLFVEAPAGDWQSMLKNDYLSERASLVSDVSMGTAEPGNPRDFYSSFGVQIQQPESGTSHISIVDRDGNAVSMTTTIESGFGSRIMSDGGTGLPGGFLLNNELTDFSLAPYDDAGNPIANRVEPGKRPRSSMSPTLVFDRETGEFVASLGSPGGAAIIHYTAKALIGMLDWGLNAQEAIDLPNFANFNGPSVLEEGYFPDSIIEALEAMGHEVNVRALTSGLQAIKRTEDGFFGGADPRREGVVMGD